MRRTRIPRRAAAALALCAAACVGSGGLPSIEQVLGLSTSSEGDLVAGLVEALEVGTTQAVARTSSVDGFLGDERIRIPLPDSLQTMASGLRAVGFGSQVEAFEVAMNRAAEQAAGEATEVFWQGIRQLTFADAQAIFNGGDTAATEYFERTTRDTLRSRFEPIVDEKMNEVGVVRTYEGLLDRYMALPFTKKPALDLGGYVTEGALDGLFEVLGEEERRIRTDPAARTTALLRQVFGAR